MLLVSYKKQNKERGGLVFLFVQKQRTRENTRTHQHTAREGEVQRKKSENSRKNTLQKLSVLSKDNMSKLLSYDIANLQYTQRNPNFTVVGAQKDVVGKYVSFLPK